MTSGKNGTYLNTIIPGPGVYNRKKIQTAILYNSHLF